MILQIRNSNLFFLSSVIKKVLVFFIYRFELLRQTSPQPCVCLLFLNQTDLKFLSNCMSGEINII